ncbi:MAG: type II toxin-antitoxin system VapC family toxin [Kiritimatiellae bacterium]|nr:type II toxin-antitoxin system VapC family toxin [Kiritimatiellia bacterium]
MKAFFDSSAFAKRYIEEPGSAVADEICMTIDQLGLSVICLPEIISALNRRLREKTIAREQYGLTKQRLSDDIRDADIINLTPEVVTQAIMMLEVLPLRTMDALHLACAYVWGAELFVSADKLQVKGAERFGLKAKLI